MMEQTVFQSRPKIMPEEEGEGEEDKLDTPVADCALSPIDKKNFISLLTMIHKQIETHVCKLKIISC